MECCRCAHASSRCILATTCAVKYYIERCWHLCCASYRNRSLKFAGWLPGFCGAVLPFSSKELWRCNATPLGRYKLYLRVVKNRCILKRQFAFLETGAD